MPRCFGLARTVPAATVVVLLCTFGPSAPSAEINVLRTNWIERSITNVIEMRMPWNVFVNQYTTNRYERFITNVVNVAATNWQTKTLTNTAVVDLWKTNWVNTTVTNIVVAQAVHTNFVPAYKTNWSTVTLTKEIVLDSFHTNFVNLYQTNSKTLNFTNWQTVLVFRTNWVTQLATNNVEIEMLTNRLAAASEGRQPKAPAAETASAQSATFSAGLALEASRTARPSINGQAELLLSVRWAGEPPGHFQVQLWHVEREDGTILCNGQDQEFRRELPFGKYEVEVKGHREAGGPLLAARWVVELTAHQASIRQTFAGK